ncbi:large ribosomal subunit protein bL28 [Bellilinea sp.]|jgi:ribosomal protein L28
MTRKLNHKARRFLVPKTRFGRNVSFSQRHTSRQFKPNLQWVTIEVDGKTLRLQLSARQIRTLGKERPCKKLWAALKQLAG